MKRFKKALFIFNALIILIICSCKKSFLDAKPSTDIVQPTSVGDFQSLLDNYNVINMTSGLAVLAGDEYVYSSDDLWKSARTATERNSYTWAKNLYEGENSDDWNQPYGAIFYANNVLSGVEKIKSSTANDNQKNGLKGWALFVRAFAFYELADNFSPVYNTSTASTDLGVPLRLNPSIDEILPRSTVKQTYDLIISDLTQATALLNDNLPVANRNRPSKIAAHALFARIFLQMRDYTRAELHADSCLKLYNKLIDYNTLSKTATTPFSTTNDELIYSKTANIKAAYVASSKYIQTRSDLISLYEPNDLRLAIYFVKQSDGTYDTKRGYHGNGGYPFVGLATDEIYLIKAECLARRGDTNGSMDVLNQLLIKRWNPNATSPAKPYKIISAVSADDALAKILIERRKELVWRGLRWDDLKRLNKEGANITLSRAVNGQSFTLPANSPEYIFPIPDNEISLSGIQQNLR